jgi:hypothetical protein
MTQQLIPWTGRYPMNISGIGVLQAQLNQQQSTQKPLEQTLLERTLTTGKPYERESIHMEIELKDGTSLSIDYVREGMTRKASYEIGRYGDYTYGNDLFSPENTAERILAFARSLWDGSEEKLELLANAIEQGVREAREILGNIPGWLDSIIGSTEDLLHQGLARMRAETGKAA